MLDSAFNQQVNRKALELNLDERVYGTFAEIGAGQEVARRFFFVGAAAGTVAKTMSAYDMTFSDAIYGAATRYVSRQRLEKMLDHEFELLRERLAGKMGDRRSFFVFADTVAARSYRVHDESHGWLGIRFQTRPQGPVNDIIIHVRMLDAENIAQQEALGIIGVNLVYAAFRHHADPPLLLQSLLDDLTSKRLEIDMVRFSGPDFAGVDNRLMSLHLVAAGLGRAAMFNADGEVVQPAEVLYKRPVLIERGSFRPITHVTHEMLERAAVDFRSDAAGEGEPLTIMEITMQNLLNSGGIDHRDFLDRTDILGALGHTVLVSNFAEYFRLVDYVSRHTTRRIGLALGVPSLEEIFTERYYTGLDGGILEGLGRLFKTNVRLYAYPKLGPGGSVVSADKLEVAGHLRHLYAHLLENRCIVPLHGYNPDHLGILSREVLERIRSGDPRWEEQVPPQVSHIIRSRGLLGCHRSPPA